MDEIGDKGIQRHEIGINGYEITGQRINDGDTWIGDK